MDQLISTIVSPDPGSLTLVNDVLARARKAVAGCRRDEVISALANSGHKLAVVDARLFVSGVRLA